MKKFLSLSVLFCVLLSFFASCGHRHEYADGKCASCGAEDPALVSRYARALDLIADGDYTAAYGLLETLGDYKDTKEMLTCFRFIPSRVVIDSVVGILETVYSYGEHNLPTELFTTRLSGTEASVDRITGLTYDEKGRLTEKTITSYGVIDSVYSYEYDANGNMTMITTAQSGRETVTEFSYDTGGFLVKELRTYPDGTVYTAEYKYDEKGRLTEKCYVGHSSVSTLSYKYIYDEKGNLVCEINVDPFVGGQIVTNYTYDGKGVLTKKSVTYADGDRVVTEFEYDDAGRLLKEDSGESARTYA